MIAISTAHATNALIVVLHGLMMKMTMTVDDLIVTNQQISYKNQQITNKIYQL